MSTDTSASSSQLERSIAHERRPDERPFAEVMIEVRRSQGKEILRQVREMAALAFGRGGVTPAEYYAWRLFDQHLSDEDRSRFAGVRAMRKVWRTCNFETDWFGIVWDKMAVYALLEGFGFPVPSTEFVLHSSRSFGAVPVARTREDLAALLRASPAYPLFCKPNGSYQSLGAAAAVAYVPARDKLVMAGGEELPVSAFAADVERYAAEGYLVQKRLVPHPALSPVCGDNLSTVRVLVMLAAEGPRILRAAWKLPSVSNIADNYWRPGNMMAALDPESGTATRLVSGFGIDLGEFESVPGLMRPVKELTVPDWPRLRDLSLAAASAVGHLRLIGWDIGITESGPVIVEANGSPDLALHQVAEGRGMLDENLSAFLAYCAAQRRLWRAERRRRSNRIVAAEFAQVRAHSRLTRR